MTKHDGNTEPFLTDSEGVRTLVVAQPCTVVFVSWCTTDWAYHWATFYALKMTPLTGSIAPYHSTRVASASHQTTLSAVCWAPQKKAVQIAWNSGVSHPFDECFLTIEMILCMKKVFVAYNEILQLNLSNINLSPMKKSWGQLVFCKRFCILCNEKSVLVTRIKGKTKYMRYTWQMKHFNTANEKQCWYWYIQYNSIVCQKLKYFLPWFSSIFVSSGLIHTYFNHGVSNVCFRSCGTHPVKHTNRIHDPTCKMKS